MCPGYSYYLNLHNNAAIQTTTQIIDLESFINYKRSSLGKQIEIIENAIRILLITAFCK